MEYSRQVNIFKPDEFNTPVHVIGVGATGSWLALSLAKLGVKNIHVWDDDIVEEHNIPNQVYGVKDIGRYKVEALKEIIKEYSDIDIIAHQEKLIEQPLQGIIFVLTDTMHSRERIYRNSRVNPNIKLLIETRMDLRGGRVYTVSPRNRDVCKAYEDTFYSDEESEVSACGVSQTVIATGLGIVSRAVWCFLAYVNEYDVPFEVLDDFSNFYCISNMAKENVR